MRKRYLLGILMAAMVCTAMGFMAVSGSDNISSKELKPTETKSTEDKVNEVKSRDKESGRGNNEKLNPPDKNNSSEQDPLPPADRFDSDEFEMVLESFKMAYRDGENKSKVLSIISSLKSSKKKEVNLSKTNLTVTTKSGITGRVLKIRERPHKTTPKEVPPLQHRIFVKIREIEDEVDWTAKEGDYHEHGIYKVDLLYQGDDGFKNTYVDAPSDTLKDDDAKTSAMWVCSSGCDNWLETGILLDQYYPNNPHFYIFNGVSGNRKYYDPVNVDHEYRIEVIKTAYQWYAFAYDENTDEYIFSHPFKDSVSPQIYQTGIEVIDEVKEFGAYDKTQVKDLYIYDDSAGEYTNYDYTELNEDTSTEWGAKVDYLDSSTDDLDWWSEEYP